MRAHTQPYDRRGSMRRPFVTRVAVKTPKAIYFMEARNISLGGAYVESEIEIPPGTRCRIVPFVEDCADVFEAAGHIVRSHHDGQRVGMGIAFDTLADSDVQILEGIVREATPGVGTTAEGTA